MQTRNQTQEILAIKPVRMIPLAAGSQITDDANVSTVFRTQDGMQPYMDEIQVQEVKRHAELLIDADGQT